MRADAGAAPDAPACSAATAAGGQKPADVARASKRTPLDGIYRWTRRARRPPRSSTPRTWSPRTTGIGASCSTAGKMYYTQASEGHARWTRADLHGQGPRLQVHGHRLRRRRAPRRGREDGRGVHLPLEPLPRPAAADTDQGRGLAGELPTPSRGGGSATRREPQGRRGSRPRAGSPPPAGSPPEPPAERLDPVGEPAQAAAARRVGAARAVVGDRDHQPAAARVAPRSSRARRPRTWRRWPAPPRTRSRRPPRPGRARGRRPRAARPARSRGWRAPAAQRRARPR